MAKTPAGPDRLDGTNADESGPDDKGPDDGCRLQAAARHDVGLDPGLDLGPLPRLTGYALRRAQLTVFDDFIATLAELDLRPAQYSVLLVLERNPGSTQTAVAAALGIQRANFVALLDGLERKGLARRAPSLTDRRSHALALTPRGAQTLRKAHALVAEHDQRMIDKIGSSRWAAIVEALHSLSDKS